MFKDIMRFFFLLESANRVLAFSHRVSLRPLVCAGCLVLAGGLGITRSLGSSLMISNYSASLLLYFV